MCRSVWAKGIPCLSLLKFLSMALSLLKWFRHMFYTAAWHNALTSGKDPRQCKTPKSQMDFQSEQICRQFLWVMPFWWGKIYRKWPPNRVILSHATSPTKMGWFFVLNWSKIHDIPESSTIAMIMTHPVLNYPKNIKKPSVSGCNYDLQVWALSSSGQRPEACTENHMGLPLSFFSESTKYTSCPMICCKWGYRCINGVTYWLLTSRHNCVAAGFPNDRRRHQKGEGPSWTEQRCREKTWKQHQESRGLVIGGQKASNVQSWPNSSGWWFEPLWKISVNWDD